MPKPKKEEKLLVEVTLTWPLRRVKTVQVRIDGKDLWHNDITLTAEQADELFNALGDILGKETLVS
jgi:hypothetical protein